MRLLHPIIPFVTEEIWQKLPGAHGSVMVASFPTPEDGRPDPAAERRMSLIQETITVIRNIRGEVNIHPGQKVEVVAMSENPESRRILEGEQDYVMTLAKLKSLIVVPPADKPRGAAAHVAGDVEIFVILKGVIDLDEEAKRLRKELDKIGRASCRERV